MLYSLLFPILCASIVHSQYVDIFVGAGQCMGMILPDGLSNSCYDTDMHVSIGSDLYRYDEALVFVYNRNTLNIINMEHIQVPPHLRITSAENDTGKKVLVTWPHNNAVVTSHNVDFHFYLRRNELLTHLNNSNGQQQLCLYVKSISNNVDYVANHCLEPQQQYFTTSLLNSKYEVSWYVKESPSSNMESGLDGDLDQTQVVHVLNSRKFEVLDLSPRVLSDEKISRSDVEMKAELKIDSDTFRVGSDRETMHVVFLSCRSLDRYREAETMLKSLLYHREQEASSHDVGSAPRPLVVHMILDPSGVRYMDDMWSSNGISTSTVLNSTKLSEKYTVSAYTLDTNTISNNITVVYHDFRSVCQNPLESLFLHQLKDHAISFHHSGAAGYCRLFLPDYFADIRTMASNSMFNMLHFNQYIFPSSVIMALETDQLILGSIEELWNHHISSKFSSVKGIYDLTDDVLVSAAENYQPWRDSRRSNSDGGNETLPEDKSGDRPYHLSTTEYRGYGVIGGVMIFNLVAIDKLPSSFIDEMIPYIRRYQSEHDEYGSKVTYGVSEGKSKWMAKLNDQDLFNVYFIYKPYTLYILPCEWNVQFHARLNSFISCAADTIKPLLEKHELRYPVMASRVPLNCPASIEKHVFVCSKRAKVLHYMAQSYAVYSDVLQYYANFWNTYVSLSWNIILEMDM